MSEKSAAVKHLGTKTLALYFGMIVSIIYALLKFFANPTLELDDLYNIAVVTVFFVVVWPLIVFLAQILWKYAHKLSELIGE